MESPHTAQHLPARDDTESTRSAGILHMYWHQQVAGFQRHTSPAAETQTPASHQTRRTGLRAPAKYRTLHNTSQDDLSNLTLEQSRGNEKHSTEAWHSLP
jgi:hypothetical protein